MIGSQAVHDTLRCALDGSLPETGGAPVHLLGEAVELSPATRGLTAVHPSRVHLLPASDAGLVGVGIGLALSGGVAVVELAEAAALWGALPQLAEAVALSSAECPVRLVVRVPCGPDAAALAPEALLRGLPGLAIGAPSTPEECGTMLRAALGHPGPTVLLESRPVLAGGQGQAPEPLGVGQARWLRQGEHATVLAWADAVQPALQAAADLAQQGVSVDVLDLRWLAPLDAAAIGQRVRHTGRVVVAGPAGAAVQAAVEHAFLRLEAPPVLVDAPEPAAIVAAVLDTLDY